MVTAETATALSPRYLLAPRMYASTWCLDHHQALILTHIIRSDFMIKITRNIWLWKLPARYAKVWFGTQNDHQVTILDSTDPICIMNSRLESNLAQRKRRRPLSFKSNFFGGWCLYFAISHIKCGLNDSTWCSTQRSSSKVRYSL